jgi:SAM-dependent methyltransferase
MFARIYDLLMEDIDFEPFLSFLSEHLKKDQLILDAGCGSGYIYQGLRLKGYEVIGIDNDSTMLSLAKEKCDKAHIDAKLYEHDLRNPIPVKVDAIVMMFDVINYFKGVKQLIKRLMNALNSDGFLLFDCYKEEMLSVYNNYEEFDDSIIPYTWKTISNKDTITHNIDVDNNTYTIKQYIQSLDYYIEIMKAFNYAFEIIDGPDERKHYIKVYKSKNN